MDKRFTILKKRLLVSGFLFFSLLGLSAAFAMAGTISNSNTLDVTAIVPGNNTNNNNGGGGSNPPQTATVVMSGYAFPNANITVLKDGAIYSALIANPNGSFLITINNLTFGNYQFSINAQDPQGNTSAPYTINMSVFSATTYQYSDIVIPPTISSSAVSVQIGNQFVVSGYAPMGATVSLEIPGTALIGTATADGNGLYTITATANQTPGTYSIRAKAHLGGVDSLYSKPIQVLFYPANQKPPGPPVPYGTCVDYNKDRRVNLIDFSILLYWFGNHRPPSNIDCNGDHVIDIRDFSLLMYYWTG